MRRLAPYICALFLCLSGVQVSFAQEGSGITLTPATVEEDGVRGETKTFTLTIGNQTSEEQTYRIYGKNIEGADDGATPIFADDGEPTPYAMTDWMRLPTTPIVVGAGSTTDFAVTVEIPNSASSGSYMAGIFISPSTGTTTEDGVGSSSPRYELVSIVNIEVQGDALYEARIRSFSADRLLYNKKDVVFTIEIENQGNTLIRPSGTITISNIFGTKEETFLINEVHAGIFPETTREFDFHFTSNRWEFGKHTAMVALAYETAEGVETIDATLIFWVFPIKVMVLLGVLGATVILVGYVLKHYYVRQTTTLDLGGRRLPQTKSRRRTGMSKTSFVYGVLMVIVAVCIVLIFIFKT